MMNRRYFLKQSIAIAPLITAFDPLSAAGGSFLNNLLSEESPSKKVLVLIQLIGGNDGLNTFIPIDKYNILSEARGNILIPENKILKLNDTNAFGFHPAMSGLRKLYDDKLLTIVQGIGYPNTNFSHTIASYVKYTGNPNNAEKSSGWLGRYLEYECPNYPNGYPMNKTDGPPAIREGEMVSPKITEVDEVEFGISINADVINFTQSETIPEEKPAANNMGSINVKNLTSDIIRYRLYAPTIQTFAKRQETLSKLYPEQGKNPLADQLKMVAKLIGGGLNTQVYIVNQSNYDFHSDQVERTDPTLGAHANLLGDLSEAISAFEDDLHMMGKQDNVLGMTFSEFGRRIASTDYGTDHGTAETVILFGTKLKNRIIGKSPDLPSKVNSDDNLPIQFDFRSLYKTVLKDWMGVSDDRVKRIIAQGPDERLDLFKV